MKKCGTYRYLQNIGGFIGSAERRSNMGFEPKLYRPEGVSFVFKKKFYASPKNPSDVV